MTPQEFIKISTEIWTAPHAEMRYNALLRTHQAFTEKQHEIDLLKAELAAKAESETVLLGKGQLAWLLEYLEGDYSDAPLEIVNSPNGLMMRDTEMPQWGWEGIKSEPRYQASARYDEFADAVLLQESPVMDWTVDQLTQQDPVYIITFCDEAIDEIFADLYIEDCHQVAQLIENVETEKATPTDVRETGEICLLWVFLENGPA